MHRSSEQFAATKKAAGAAHTITNQLLLQIIAIVAPLQIWLIYQLDTELLSINNAKLGEHSACVKAQQ